MGKEQATKIPGETFTIRVRAQQLFSFWQVARRLNLDDADRELALAYTTERLIKTGVYETSSLLNHPLSVVMATGRFLGGLKSAERSDKNRRDALEYQREEIETQIQANCSSPEQRRRVRIIELAINTLIAEATPKAPTEKLLDKMTLSDEQLHGWAARWCPQLAQTTAPQTA